MIDLTSPLSRVIQMVLVLILFGGIETILTRRYPYIEGARLGAGDKILGGIWLLTIAQPLLLPALGIAYPSVWTVLSGWLVSGMGLILYYMARHRLGSHSANPVVPSSGYIVDGVYRYLHHPMYVSFALMATGISLIGFSILSPVLIVATIALFFGYKAPREEKLRANTEI